MYKVRVSTITSVLSLLVFLSFSTSVAGQILVNGSFESPPVTSNRQIDGFNNQAITGWQVFAPTNGFLLMRTAHFDGQQSVLLNGDGRSVSLQQTFSTVPGNKYRVEFAMSDENLSGPTPTVLDVRVFRAESSATIGNVPLADVLFDRKADSGWAKKSFEFVAASRNSTLSFSDFTPQGASASNPLVDAVIVTELGNRNRQLVAALVAAAAIGVGLAVFLFMRKKRFASS